MGRKKKIVPDRDDGSPPQLSFDDEGCLLTVGPVPLSKLLLATRSQLGIFLEKLARCDRNNRGSYLTGNKPGLRVIWGRVWLLAASAHTFTLDGGRLTPREEGATIQFGLKPSLNAQPLVETLVDLYLRPMYLDNQTLISELSAASMRDLRGIHRELKTHIDLQQLNERTAKRADRRDHGPPTASIANGDLAKRAGLSGDYVSKLLKAALAAAGQSLPRTGRGIALNWTHGQLRRALPKLKANGKLRLFLEKSGFNKPD